MTDTLRLAFWGRVSTEDNQDIESSRGWQLTRACTLIEPRGGQIVAEYFDIDKSRSIPPARRPRASALLAALADPNRGFEAVVVGEPQRAFYGNQFGNTFPIFAHYGVPLWVPEVGGPIDPDNEAHDLIMSVFGGVSKGERNRIKIRVRTAMAAQAHLEGRFLGGRPPYGYKLIDAGPHPNPAKAVDGKRLHALEIDDSAAGVVERIYGLFLDGHGLLAIAEHLTRHGIPCPSAHDPRRNSHRSGIAWSKGAIRAILTNPRYTGRQVWNKQRKDEVLIDVSDVALGHTTKMRWNDGEQWIYSEKVVHPALVSDDTFAEVQQLLAGRSGGQHKPHRSRHDYALRGLLVCGLCDRRMQGHWANAAPYYRCSFATEYGLANHVQHPRNVTLRQDAILGPLDKWLFRKFDARHLAQTIDELTAAAKLPPAPVDGPDGEAAARIADCDRKLTGYRAALDAGGDPAVISRWITETTAERARLVTRTRPATPRAPMTREQIASIVIALGDILAVLADADPADKAEIYSQLGLRLTYQPSRRIVRAEAHLDQTPHWDFDSVRGASKTIRLWRCAVGRLSRGRHGMTGQADRWIRRTTIGCVGMLALIAGTVSYLHMHLLVQLHGQPGWVAALTPLSVDGMIVAASTTLLAESRSGGRGGILPWALLVVGSVASLAANVAVAEPTATGRVIAAWPSFALIASYELLMRQVRRAAEVGTSRQRSGGVRSRPERASSAGRRGVQRPDAGGGPAGRGWEAQVLAWQWALANQSGDGSLPSGRDIGREHGRHERWGRLVKRSGMAGELDPQT